MGATDMPFSITSKFLTDGGAEHLVTIRATTIDQFRQRLGEAATVFPYAGFAHVETHGEVTVLAPAVLATAQATEPKAPVSITQARNQVMRQEQGAAAVANVQQARQAQGGYPKCPRHGRAAQSKFYKGLYCPDMDEETGERCKWVWKPQEATGS